MQLAFALLGHPVAHTLSPAMHAAAFRALGLDAAYLAIDVAPADLEVAVRGTRALGFRGLNLTIPHKEAVMSLVQPDEMASRIGAVNTVDLRTMTGHNTDGVGVVRALRAEGVEPRGMRVLVMGAGGAARAVAVALSQEGARLTVANRDVDRARRVAAGIPGAAARGLESVGALARQMDLVVNATPVGMHPDIGSALVTRDDLRPGQVVFDTVYNPPQTRLLAEARAAGAQAVNGVKMLVHQGAESLRIWLGVQPPLDVMEAAVREGLAAPAAREDAP